MNNIKERSCLLLGGFGVCRASVVLEQFYISSFAFQKLQEMGYNLKWRGNNIAISNAHVFGFIKFNENALAFLSEWNDRFPPMGLDGNIVKNDKNSYMLMVPVGLGADVEITKWNFIGDKNGRKQQKL